MPNEFKGKGNLGDNPTLKTVPVKGKDRSVCEMRVFFDEYRQNENGEIVQNGGFWMTVALWDRKGEDAHKHLRKGARIHVDGYLEQFIYKDKETGKELTAFQVVAQDVNLSLSRVEEIKFRAKREQEHEAPIATAA